MPVIDTTLLIAGEGTKESRAFIADLLAAGEPLYVPVQVAIEYAAGRADPAAAIRMIRSAFVLVPIGPDIALEAARMAKAARQKGLFPGWADVQIAATASHEGMAVVTANKRHFEALGVAVVEHPL